MRDSPTAPLGDQLGGPVQTGVIDDRQVDRRSAANARRVNLLDRPSFVSRSGSPPVPRDAAALDPHAPGFPCEAAVVVVMAAWTRSRWKPWVRSAMRRLRTLE
jgi:hypothetical protein